MEIEYTHGDEGRAFYTKGHVPLDEFMAAVSSNCWCESCDIAEHPNVLGGRTRMSVCPNCGDKRCARAKHHDATCSNPTT